jgi:hypothetical protein
VYENRNTKVEKRKNREQLTFPFGLFSYTFLDLKAQDGRAEDTEHSETKNFKD